MSFGWQDLVAWAIVAGAVMFLLWRFFFKKRHSPGGSPGCESCCGCSAAKPQPPLVSLEPPRRGEGEAR